MDTKNPNEELQSRREFFKKAAKAALPVVGAVVLSSLPILKSEAAPTGCYSGSCEGWCTGSCAGGCGNGCGQNACMYSCNNTCDRACAGKCVGYCTGSCYSTCQGNNYGFHPNLP